MALLNKNTIVSEVRRRLDEIVFGDEIAELDSEIQGSLASNFSNEELGNRVNDAARYVAARVQAMFLPELIDSATVDQVINYNVLRLLGSRVKVTTNTYGEVVATRRSFHGQRKMDARNVQVTEEFPIYIFSDYELRIFPDPLESVDNAKTDVDFVRVPGTPFGQTINQTREPVEELDERFKEAVINRTLVYCFTMMELYNMTVMAQSDLTDVLKPYMISRSKIGSQVENS